MEKVDLDFIVTPKLISPFRYVGGKRNMVKQILPLIPEHLQYIEPYCGSGAIFFSKTRSKIEVLNDINSDIVNFFRVLQNEELAEKLVEKLVFTPYSYEEFKLAGSIVYGEEEDLVLRAWGWFVLYNQGFGGTGDRNSWGKTKTLVSRNISDNVNSWRGRLKLLEFWMDRLQSVQIEHRDALECIQYWDTPTSFFYLDPPYVRSTRKKTLYTHETNDAHHQRLVDILLSLKGRFVLSGYWNDLYSPLLEICERINIDRAISVTGRTKDYPASGTSSITSNPEKMRVETLLVKR